MIPKVIHYCWFGGKPLPELAEKCIASWEKYLPDHEIKKWDETNFDVNLIPYISQAYKAKKYAFVSDYARLWILYNYGGLYFDTDVEIIKTFNEILEQGAFMGCENPSVKGGSPLDLGVNPGLGIGVEPRNKLYKRLLDLYTTLQFYTPQNTLMPYNTTTIVTYTTRALCELGLENNSKIQEIAGIKIYPVDYFCPIDYKTHELRLTSNTVSIHHYAESWHGKREKIYRFVGKCIGRDRVKKIVDVVKSLLK